MDAIVRWFVLAISLLVMSNICLARNLDQVIPETATRWTSRVSINVTRNYVVMDNGIFQLTIANPYGFVTGIRYNGVENLLEDRNDESDRGYFDVVWNAAGRCGGRDCTDEVAGTTFNIIRKSIDRSEISFTAKWNRSTWTGNTYPSAPINVDRRYVMYRGFAGYYSYTILEREASFPPVNFHQIRAVYKLHGGKFHYMAMSDDRQRLMPTPQDIAKGEALDYKEAVRLINPVNPDMNGEVDDKYQYACDDRENKLHGWIGSNPMVGFWLISPSDDSRTAGPFKQDLTSHVGPTCLQMFHSAHYMGARAALVFNEGEPWKKVFGPFLVYLNSNKKHTALWQDAKRQLAMEIKRWPYEFPLSTDYAKPAMRGTVSGRLLVKDRYGKNLITPAANAWVGLAAVGEAGSWQLETKGYQFWVTANKNGSFMIHGVLEGTYNLYATVPGFIGNYKYAINIQIKSGRHIMLHDIIYEPPRNGPTLWEIGIPDRTAAEFFVPDPNPRLVNKLFLNKPHHKFRQYGLWQRYTELYPQHDLVYTIGKSDYRKDWFFAHVPRKDGNAYKATTWQVVFPIANLQASTVYTLRMALASASSAEVQVRFNDPTRIKPLFTTRLFGKDNAIARHGIHGLYHPFNIDVPSSWLLQGNNTLYLTQTRQKTPIDGVMYDYIRLEGPPGKFGVP